MVGTIIRAGSCAVFQIAIIQLRGENALVCGLIDHMIAVRDFEFGFRTGLIRISNELQIMGVRGPRSRPAARSPGSIHGVNTRIGALG